LRVFTYRHDTLVQQILQPSFNIYALFASRQRYLRNLPGTIARVSFRAVTFDVARLPPPRARHHGLIPDG
jgi:hypothetical protein